MSPILGANGVLVITEKRKEFLAQVLRNCAVRSFPWQMKKQNLTSFFTFFTKIIICSQNLDLLPVRLNF